jgi:hypothetical protein
MKRLLIFIFIFAITINNGTSSFATALSSSGTKIPGLDLTRENVHEFHFLDLEKQAYWGIQFGYVLDGASGELYSSEEIYPLVADMFAKLHGKAKPTGTITPVREGDIVVFLVDGTRYSYKIEEGNILNINGVCYKVEAQALIDFQKAFALIKNARQDFQPCPKWLAWMNVSNITSITRFTSTNKQTKVYPNALKGHANLIYRTIDIESAEPYKVQDVLLPNDSGVFKVVITFESGVSYTLVAKGKVLYIELSDRAYGLKYLTKTGAEALIEQYDFWAWAEKDEDFHLKLIPN